MYNKIKWKKHRVSLTRCLAVFPTINIPDQKGTVFIINEPTWSHYYHSKSIAVIRSHSWFLYILWVFVFCIFTILASHIAVSLSRNLPEQHQFILSSPNPNKHRLHYCLSVLLPFWSIRVGTHSQQPFQNGSFHLVICLRFLHVFHGLMTLSFQC